MKYLRIENNDFMFLDDGINVINEVDLLVKDEDYNLFFENQSKGISYKLKDNFDKEGGLWDILEEYEPEPIEQPKGTNEIENLKNQILDLQQLAIQMQYDNLVEGMTL